MKKISLLGSTGSIGQSTLDVVRKNADKFTVLAMSCGSNIDLFAQQINEFKPQLVSVQNTQDISNLKEKIKIDLEIFCGEEGNIAVATHPETEFLLSAIVGAAGLKPTYAAILAKKTIGLANKESMVIAGELMNHAALENHVQILPVDSEHSAIFQCLNGEKIEEVRRMVLTASGGPFLHKAEEEFKQITVEQALKHPNWSMGAKITIDSASLMNKGLELIEARWIFNIAPEKLDVIVHPQSIVHSMIEFQDGSVMAQLGIPDMRIPIAYAMSYPERLKNDLPSLDLAKISRLDFLEPNTNKFRCLALAKQVLSNAGTYAAVLNAANEIAVENFLKKRISFTDIPVLVEEALQSHDSQTPKSLEDILVADQWARNLIYSKIAA